MSSLDDAIGGVPVDPLDAAIDTVDQGGARLRSSLYGAVKQNPDEAARALQLSRKTGLPAPLVQRNLPQIEQRATLDDLDAVIDKNSAVGRKMTEAEFAALAHDDVGTLSGIEDLLKPPPAPPLASGFGQASQDLRRAEDAQRAKLDAFFRPRATVSASRGPAPSFGSVVSGLGESFAQGAERATQGIRLQFADTFGLDEMAADAIKKRDRAQNAQDLTTPEFDSATARGLYGGGASTLQNLPGLAASILTRSPVPSLAAAGVQTELDAYGRYRSRGGTPGEAALGATGEAVVEVATELIPLRTMLGAFGQPGKTAAKEFIKSQVQEQFGEQAATILQDAIDTAVANPNKTWGQYLAERPDAAYQTALATLVQGGVMTAGHLAVSRMAGEEARAAAATQDADVRAQLAQFAAASKLRTRDPQTFQEFVAAATEGTPAQDVYLDARTLQQSGVDVAALAQASPAVAAQLQQALATGGDLVIPMAEYATAIAGTDLDPVLTPHLRTSEESLSLDEAQRFYQGQADQFQAAAAKVMEEKTADETFKASAKVVEDKLFGELRQAGRFTDDVNSAYATIMRDFYVATSARLNITPEEMFARYPLRVAAESVAGGQRMEQTAPDDGVDYYHGTTRPEGEELKPNALGLVFITADEREAKAHAGSTSGSRTVKTRIAKGTKVFDPANPADLEKVGATEDDRLWDAAYVENTEWLDQIRAAGFDGFRVRDVGGLGAIGPWNTGLFGTGKLVRQPQKPGVANAKDSPYTADNILEQEAKDGQPRTDRPGLPAEQEPRTVGGGTPRMGWAESTRVRLKDGRPAVVYRGAGRGLGPADFGRDALGVATGNPSSGLGVWFTPHRDEAGRFGDVEPFQLDLRAPKVIKIEDLPGFDSVDAAHAFREDLRSQGYDGIAVDARHVGGPIHFVAFDAETVIRPPAAQPLDMGQFFQSDKSDLVIQHNLTAENLLHAAKMGGIPVPSLAITKKDHPLEGFGEITLLGSKELADPKGYAGTKVFGADIYSPRYPSVEYQFTPAMQKRVEAQLKDGIEATGGYIDWSEVASRGPEELARSAPFMWDFLKNRGIEPQVVYTQPTPLPDVFKPFAEDGVDAFDLQRDPAFIDAVYAHWTDELTQAYDGDRAAAEAEVAQTRKNAEDRGTAYLVRDWARRVNQYRMDSASAGKVDSYATRRMLEDQARTEGLRDEMNTAAQDLFAEVGPNERIFQGFTNSGNRRYVAHTLENVVKILKKELRGGENFNYGVGSIRAKFTPQFKSIKQIREAKDRLMDKAAFEKVKDEIDAEFFALREQLAPYHSVGGEFRFSDTMTSMMYDAAKMGVPRALRENGFGEVPTEDQQDIAEFLGRLRELPTEYFEAKILRDVDLTEFSGAVVPEGVDPKVIEALHSRGVKDIRTYKKGDEADRAAKIGEFENLFFQSSNQGNRAEISFAKDITSQPSVIALFKNADLSSFLHEMGHFQLEVLANIASRPDAPVEIVQDLDAVFEWFASDMTLGQWQAMSLEEKRPYHEAFARGFEAYLFEGKAPSTELTGLFARFRAWLVNVYKSVKALNVEISDDIRGVFDRLLATDEAIKQAEAARAFMPLFKSAEAMGDAEAWTEYQRTGEAATEDAVSDLQRRGLRDMRWLTGARGRILKQLQADAKAKRREVMLEVRQEVLSRPVYRARAFLRRKMAETDALPPLSRKSDPNVVDPTIDSLFAAIAKLGGVRKDQVLSEWGLDPKDVPQSGVFGKPVWRVEGGMPLDLLAEALARHGYLNADADGKLDLAEFYNRFVAEAGGDSQYAFAYDYAAQSMRPGEQVANPGALDAGRLDIAGLASIGVSTEDIDRLTLLRMTSREGLHPDVVADILREEGGGAAFTSGDHLVREILAAAPEAEMIEGMTDQRVLERYGDLANPDTLARAADEAIHNEARARFVATELKALSQATGPLRAITKAAKDFAEATLARKKVRDIKPRQHAAAETRAAKAAEKAMAAGDTALAAVEKRNQLVQNYSTRTAYDALDEINKAVKYLRKFDSEGTRKNLDTEYVDQIDQLLERFDLRASVGNKDAAKREKLAAWLESQREQGFEPDIPADLVDSAMRKPYRELTLEELRGLVDTVKQIEHLGRLKQKLLTAKDEREFAAVVDAIRASITANAKGTRDLRTRNTTGAMLKDAGNRFLAMHRKMASVSREMDGFTDGGPMWEYFIRSMNAAGDRETTHRAAATAKLYELIKPLLKSGRMGGKGQYFETLGASFNREERIAIALNLGNAGNMQRLLGGEGWTPERLKPLLDTITPEEADFVQAVWDFFESYRPEIAAKERRIYGREPEWVDPQPVVLGGKTLRGGYYPIKYDTARSGRAEQHADAEAAKAQMRGAYTSATTRRSFTKARAEEVTGRPLMYSFTGLYQGANEVIHDLAWHEWLIDANRLLRAIDGPMRLHYGAETVGLFKAAIQDIAAGDVPAQNVFERGLNHVRTGATIAGLGWNLTTSLLQPIGLTQSMARIGPGWVAKGMGRWIKAPLATLEDIQSKSAMMTDRARTMQREINEIQNQVRGSQLDPVRSTFFVLIQKMQMLADVPTWLGAYEKHIAAGEVEERAAALADQAVLDAQGGGQMKDLSQIQRGHPALKLFTNFYSFFNVLHNLGVEKTKQKIGDPKLYPSLALDYLLLYTLPAVIVTVMKEAILGGGDDEDELVDKIIADQISYLLGTMVGLREVTAAAQKVAGVEQFKGSYGGPAGLRLFQEIDKLGQQVGQGEADMALFKSANNVAGIVFHYPSGQVNRSAEGAAAMIEGKTENPMSLVVGPPKE